jgi:hypothetical protein
LLGNPFFGQIDSARDPRIMQLALKLIFEGDSEFVGIL